MKKRILVCVLLLLIVSGGIGFHVIFDIPTDLTLTTTSGINDIPQDQQCLHYSKERVFLDKNKALNLLVWNIFKENRSNALSKLFHLSKDRQLIMLQEVKLSRSFTHYAKKNHWDFYHIDAFGYRNNKNGVLTAAKTPPNKVCGYLEMEPWLRLPKSSLISYYPLSNGSLLAVANIHAVNFSLGLQEYRHQVNQLVVQLKFHRGPIILAGDFNSWNEERIKVVNEAAEKLNLQEVHYENGLLRKQFLSGPPLDHIFFRGLEEIATTVIRTNASDHNAILSTFNLDSKG